MTAVRPTGTRLDRQQRLLAVGLVLGVTMVAFEITAVLTALPTITDELHGDSLYGVALASYTLANLVALVVTGELTDRYGPAKPYLASLVVFAAGLVVAATATSMAFVVLGRTMQGAGTGGLAPIAYVLVKRAFPADRQANMYAFLSAGWVLPSLLAPAIAGTITDQIGWRWVFWLLLPLIPVVAFITIPPMRMYAATGSGVIRHSRIAAACSRPPASARFVTSLQFGNPIALVGGALVGLAMALPSLRRLLPSGVSRVARACRGRGVPNPGDGCVSRSGQLHPTRRGSHPWCLADDSGLRHHRRVALLDLRVMVRRPASRSRSAPHGAGRVRH